MSADGRTPEIRAAEQMIDERMTQAEEALAKATRFESELPEVKLTDERIEEIEQQIRSGNAPPEIVAFQRRVDEGEFSWHDVADGTAFRDESVRSAFSASVQNMQQAKDMLDAGYDSATVINNDPNRSAGADYDDEPPDSFLR